MGYFGKLEEKEKAKRLRKKGYSYNQIKTETRLSKDTICKCCRDIELTKNTDENFNFDFFDSNFKKVYENQLTQYYIYENNCSYK